MDRAVRLFDSVQGRKVELLPVVPGEVSIYFCGPTVYNHVHLGNIRPAVTFDLLTRVLRARGYWTRVVSNYTDIDDKIIAEAQREDTSEEEVAAKYIDAYERTVAPLHLLPLDAKPRASQTIGEMIDLIQVLMDRGYAYKSGDDVFFSVGKISDYGAISHVDLESNVAGKRVETQETKRDPRDFALWKLTSDEGVKFDSPFGTGRPGWHTECVTMIKNTFEQPVIDIHGGGFDLKFPHHENERAQSIGYDGTGLAHIWMHVGFLTAAQGEKMSKSLGNVILAKDVLSEHSGNAVRIFFYRTHYRAPLAYSDEALKQAGETAERFESAYSRLTARIQLLDGILNDESYDSDAVDEVIGHLSDDLNSANALSVAERETRKALTLLRSERTPLENLVRSAATVRRIMDLLGIQVEPRSLSEEERELYSQYQEARAAKDFETSDRLRSLLMDKGIL